MTNAQRADFFKAKKTGRSSGEAAASTGRSAPGAVRQIVVTLSSEVHDKLRSWSTSNGMGQDAAAGGIIARFLETVYDEKRNGSGPTDAAASAPS